MQEIKITANDAGRRLDRFLRKYFKAASLSEIYKIIRKDAKVDGKRRNENYMLQEGEVLTLYMSDETISKFIGSTDSGAGRSGAKSGGRDGGNRKAKRQFNIVFEDENVLIADKPFGLLTHGDIHEKKNHLANQVKDYLIEKGEFNPRAEKVFSPAPANRIDRNTTGLVLFGKTATALKGLNKIIREDKVSKFYLTIVSGTITEELDLSGSLVKDRYNNKVKISKESSDEALEIRTIVRPLEQLSYWDRGSEYETTLVEVELVTGRSHQIRAHLASVGHPIIGDSKYAGKASAKLNNSLQHRCGLSTQLLHAYRLEFADELDEIEGLEYLEGQSFVAKLPERFSNILIKMGSMTEL